MHAHISILTTVTHPNPITMSSHGRIVKPAKPNPNCKVSEIIITTCNNYVDTRAVNSRSNVMKVNITFLAGPSNI